MDTYMHVALKGMRKVSYWVNGCLKTTSVILNQWSIKGGGGGGGGGEALMLDQIVSKEGKWAYRL